MTFSAQDAGAANSDLFTDLSAIFDFFFGISRLHTTNIILKIFSWFGAWKNISNKLWMPWLCSMIGETLHIQNEIYLKLNLKFVFPMQVQLYIAGNLTGSSKFQLYSTCTIGR